MSKYNSWAESLMILIITFIVANVYAFFLTINSASRITKLEERLNTIEDLEDTYPQKTDQAEPSTHRPIKI